MMLGAFGKATQQNTAMVEKKAINTAQSAVRPPRRHYGLVVREAEAKRRGDSAG